MEQAIIPGSMQPLVSICIPTYNGERYLKQCIDSALAQTYKNVEIVIVDDCSRDNTSKIIADYANIDGRIKFYKNEANLGLVGNWNKCVDVANGEWIKFLFQDDYLDADCVRVMIEEAEDEDILVTSGRRLVFDPELDEKTRQYSINETLTFERLGVKKDKPIHISPAKVSSWAAQNICMNFLGEPTVVMFKKCVIKDVGYFNEEISQICDFEYFLRIASVYGVKYIPVPLTWFRVHRGSTSATQMNTKYFKLRYIDPLVTVWHYLYGVHYCNFRNALSVMERAKLNLFLKVRTYETGKIIATSTKDNKEKLAEACRKYPEIGQYIKGGLLVKLIFFVVKRKRSLA